MDLSSVSAVPEEASYMFKDIFQVYKGRVFDNFCQIIKKPRSDNKH